jgi:predicted dehydrogenase
LRGGLPRGATGDESFDTVGSATIAPLVRELVRCVATGQPPSPSFEDGLRAQLVLEAIQRSAATRSWVDVEE